MPASLLPVRCATLPLFLALAAVALFVPRSRAGDKDDASKDDKAPPSVAQQVLDKITPLNTLEAETSYVGTGSFKIKEFDGSGPLNKQADYRHLDELENSITYAHRFHLFDKVYLKLGVDYERFDFGTTNAPLPSTLQSLTGVVAVEYISHGKPAAFITTKPGVFFGNSSIRTGSFDAPTSIGTFVPVPFLHDVYALLGVHVSLLSRNTVTPFGGLVWLINDDFRLVAVPPEPRLVYSFSRQLEFFVGGEVLGESYKRNSDDDARPQFKRFSDGVIDFTDERIGAGLTYKPFKAVSIDLSGGWDLKRDFDYYRGDGKRFITHGAAYTKLSVAAEF